LEYVLRKVEINTLIIGGIVTNGGVASTVRDAHVRDIHTYLLTDGTAAFDRDVHNATVTSLGSITQTATCAEMIGVVESSS
jgi:ureidoacrylate peracid hydrolase